MTPPSGIHLRVRELWAQGAHALSEVEGGPQLDTAAGQQWVGLWVVEQLMSERRWSIWAAFAYLVALAVVGGTGWAVFAP